MTNATNAGFAHKKGAVAAARKVLGKDAVLDEEFEAFEIEGGRWDWKAVERAKKQRRTSGKGSPFGKQSDTPSLDGMPIPGLEGDIAPLQEEPAPANKAANAFGAAAFAALGNMSDRRTESTGSNKGQRNGDKPAAERKPRAPAEMSNGVRKPSVGTTCRHVWDELARLQEENNGVPPDSKQVKQLAEQHKWNTNNASIEFYQWRKFNGISGRTKASAQAAKPIKK